MGPGRDADADAAPAAANRDALAPAAIDVGGPHIGKAPPPAIGSGACIGSPCRRRSGAPRPAGGKAVAEATRAESKARTDAIGDGWRDPACARIAGRGIAGAVDEGAARPGQHAHIGRRIARQDAAAAGAVDPHAGDIMDRGRGRDGIDGVGHAGGDPPRPLRCPGHEPHAVGDRVERVGRDPDDRARGILRIGQLRAGNGQEVRRALIAHGRGRGQRHRRRLRQGGGDGGISRLRGARHRDQHVCLGVGGRDAGEIRGKSVRRRIGPGAALGGSREPAAGDQHIECAGVGRAEDRVVRIVPGCQPRAGDRPGLWRSVRLDQLGRVGRHQDGRR